MNERKTYRSDLLGEEYTQIRHKSGLDIYVFPKRLTTAYAVLATNYGAADTRFRLAGDEAWVDVPDGVAHFLEHKMFANEDGIDSFEKFGALGANANAYTSHDQTAYLFSCSEKFEESLKELLTYVTHPYFTPESVEKEQGIIAQEIRMGDDNPSSQRYYQLLRALYHNRQIYTHICGTVDSITQITDQTLYACYRVFYNLSNMALVVCGDVTPGQVLRVADHVLPKQADPLAAVRVMREEPPLVHQCRCETRMQVAKPLFTIGIKDVNIPAEPSARARRDAIMSMINDLLFSQTSRLYNSLYEEGLISPDMTSSYTISESFAFHSVSGESYCPETVFDRVREYVEDIRRRGFEKEDFERCRKVFYSSFVREFDSTDDIANNLISFVFDGIEMFDYADIIASLTCEEVTETLRSDMKDELFTLSVVYPFDHKED